MKSTPSHVDFESMMIIIRKLLKALGIVDGSRSHRVQANPSRWSEESRRSLASGYTDYYRDITYVCIHCDAHAVFTAEEQRKAFEVEKRYIWHRRNLCGECWRERREVERTLQECREMWTKQRSSLQNDRGFLADWLFALELHPQYGGSEDTAHIAMIRRLLAALPQDGLAD
jgi:hypothetical protein